MARVFVMLTLSVLFAHGPLSAGRIGSEQIHIGSAITVDENGRVICGTSTRAELHD